MSQGAVYFNNEFFLLSLPDTFSQIIADEGVGALWNGTLPSLLLVFNPAVQFMIYEAMKRRAGQNGQKVSISFILGFATISSVYTAHAFCFTDFIPSDLRHRSYRKGYCNDSHLSTPDYSGHSEGKHTVYLFY